MANNAGNDGRSNHQKITDRGQSRRHKTAQNHLNAQDHYRNRAKNRINKAPKS